MPAAPPRPATDLGSPVGVLTLAVAINSVVLVGLGIALSQSATLLAASQERYLRLVELRGDIAHYDEVLTMSARMAAASGDPTWEGRYHRYEPLLDAAIAEAEALAPPAGGAAATETDAANQALVAMELEAFERVRAGAPVEAAALLDSAEYARQKGAYTAGLDAYMDDVLADVSAAVGQQQRRNRAARVGALLGGLALLGGWGVVLRRINTWRRQMEAAEAAAQDANASLVAATRALEDANTTLEQRVAERTAALRRLSEDLLHAEASERERLALVLHDDLQQLLVSAQLRLGAAPVTDPVAQGDVAAAGAAVRQALRVSRSLSTELSGDARAEDDLGAAIEALARDMAPRHGLPVDVDLRGRDAAPASAVSRFVLRAARELLFNVVKHAGASRAWLSLDIGAEALVLRIRDDGAGITADHLDERHATGLGLPAIRQRVRWLGGDLDIVGVPGGGTTVTLRAPLQPSPA